MILLQVRLGIIGSRVAVAEVLPALRVAWRAERRARHIDVKSEICAGRRLRGHNGVRAEKVSILAVYRSLIIIDAIRIAARAGKVEQHNRLRRAGWGSECDDNGDRASDCAMQRPD